MGKKKKRFLLVEDHPDTCELVSFILRDYDVTTVRTKAEAVNMAKSGGFDLFLLDYYLPDGTGEELCKQIRGFDSRTPILFVTASATFSETRARGIGAQGTLKKANPLFLSELKNRALELAPL